MARRKVWVSEYAYAWVHTDPRPVKRIKPLVQAKIRKNFHRAIEHNGTVFLCCRLEVPLVLNNRLRQLAYYDNRSLRDLMLLGLSWVVTDWAKTRKFDRDLSLVPKHGKRCVGLPCWMTFYRPIPRKPGWWKDLMVLGVTAERRPGDGGGV